MVIEVPEGSEILAGNALTSIQALSVTHKKEHSGPCNIIRNII
jgi:hypothetical protein